MTTGRVLAGTFLLMCVCASARAQDRLPLGTHVGSEPVDTVAPGARPQTPGASGYDDGGRRDPFVSLITPKKSPTAPAAAQVRPKAGLAGVALADVAVKGIIHNGAATVALLEGPGGKSFIARNKDVLQDASIKAIDADGVVFVQRVVDPLGAPHPRDVRKTLRQINEADR